MNVDNLLKSLAERYPEQFAAWLLGRSTEAVEPVEVLKTELVGEPIRADFVAFMRGSEEVLHIEFLFSRARRDETPGPLRMLDYWVRLYRQHRVPVDQVLMLVTPRSGSDPGLFEQARTRHEYRVVRLWEEDPEPLLAHEGLLPLAVLARSSDRRALISKAAAQVRRIVLPERRKHMATATYLFAGLVIDWKEVRTMFGDQEWLRESSTYQHILQEGMEEGRTEGRAEGAYLLLLGVLESRFGPVPPDLRTELGRCSLEVLQQLAPVATTSGSLEVFREAATALIPEP